jgi:tetratricopeptide (TPR) repeat protein
MEKPKEIKELTKLPKALQLKTKNETLFICKLIDKIKKNTIPTEFQEKAETELQKLLLKTKDATKA